ncbi:hypothetical protein AQUCO_00200726v1 [Aquilegia coerulea]|uniref:AAA+ ATPase domain-containing protein n=1 Tax=Aquilegia coerulea TaxID=218851 RepID=A0A2G5F4N6_AQUCA|nr:hypothetical protein AQUCO_00200726v1 [Aquilegia coerulea]
MKSLMRAKMLSKFGSTMASIMFMYAMFQQFIPYTFRSKFEKFVHKFIGYFNPNIQIIFLEFAGERLERSKAYALIQSYLSSYASNQARRLKADVGKSSTSLVLSMDNHEEVPDEYEGVKLLWSASKKHVKATGFSIHPTSVPDERRYYKLTFHKRYREIVINSYIKYVLEKGKEIAVQNRQRRLYTNSYGSYGPRKGNWSHVAFDHPATFGTLAMETQKKNEIIDDLLTFSKSKDYYAKIGKAWKRGYLLYGPPGTGKSTMISAMANLLHYDVYDLELTAVTDNTELRKLLIETSSKSIIVIEDIDCSLDLTGQRKKKKKKENDEEMDPMLKRAKEEGSSIKESKVTLSGLLNFIDGIWSACGGERIIVFTTNHVAQLDPALIRRGRMDKHIELSYCSFEGFKVLAKNYLDIDSHQLFEVIEELLGHIQMTPADVAENLMLTTITRNAETCLENLIQALKNAMEEKKLKAEEEAKAVELKKLKADKMQKTSKAEEKASQEEVKDD